MAYDHQEQEQLEALKAWFQTWGKAIAAGAVVVAAAFGGWQGWQAWQQKKANAAALVYDELQQAAQAAKADDVKRLAGTLAADYKGTAYAAMGALVAAKAELAGGDAKGAQAHYEWVIANAKLEEFAAMARLRLSGVLLDQKDYDAALKAVSTGMPAAFEALAADRRGDVLAAQGNKAEARKAYVEALDKLAVKRENQGLRQIIEIKRDALGEG
ncbi:YfgM family protein [Derxia gummosa]|uniref:Ancillary SecYEG translocon subunit n=1 Tax=Derxia gummosa DSM 723 TaxID=1121388 RepID=A0A8B6X6I9_9BURK|nr:tetratricopeptide repeat protein [Derxia gummosa]